MVFRKKEEKRDIDEITMIDSRSAASEAYRTLRTNIQFMTLDNLTRSYLIVGAHPGCGKTTTVVNLGFTMAQAGSSVLMVDTDLRRPRLHQIFNCKNFFGLTTMLIEENINMNAARHRTQIPNLDVIPSGPVPPNPAELLASRKMQRALKEFENRYDYVILDSPPLLNMADASILSRLAHATILVIGYGETTREEATKVHQQLQMAKADFIGVIINGIPPHLDPYGYYGYYREEPPAPKPKKKIARKKHSKEDDDFDLDFDPKKAYDDL